MAIKKSELYSSLWKSCDELRGGMDASQYKDYVLVLLFVKYVSDKYAANPSALIEVPPGGGFSDMVALKGQKEIGDQMNKIISRLAEANDLKGVIDVADFNDDDKLGKGKDMVDRLSNLVAIFENENLDFSKNRTEDDDILGDAYEYLMRHFATESGKSKGQFYTPAEVSRVMAKVIDISQATRQDQTIYDPTCGSGSLLLKSADESTRGVTIYGQENDNATRALAKMNMILHDNPTAEITRENTLSSPQFLQSDSSLKTFDFAVANPPFSYKAWRTGFDPFHDKYDRFSLGIPPAKNGDYAFLLHLIRSLKSNGKGAIILPHGVLFRGNVEGEIRKNIIRKGYFKGIIGLPPNLFYGTGIPACIVVIDKEHAAGRKGIFMIDASKGFVKDGNKNRLREQDIHKIVDVFNKQIEIPKYSRMVNYAEIEDEKNDFNLNIPRYIDSTEEEDIQDLEAHLLGGIPNVDIDDLSSYWSVYPNLRTVLFKDNEREGYSDLKVTKNAIKSTIFKHPEFVRYRKTMIQVFEQWRAEQIPFLKNMDIGTRPKDIIHTLSEAILKAFENKKLIDKYDIYQHLMTYWVDVMKDDLYIIAEEGWKATVRAVKKEKGKKTEGTIKIGKNEFKCELIPKEFIINRFFSLEQTEIDEMQVSKDAIISQQEELQEEHGGEEGLLEEVIGDNGKITKTNVNKRIKEIKKNPDFSDELELLQQYLHLLDQEGEMTKQMKEATQKLDKQLLRKYGELNEEEIKTIVVDDKWMTSIRHEITSEMDRISQRLARRIKELTERYENPLPKLSDDMVVLSKKVDQHLKKMGLEW